ncbi:VCBS repeat-containing protein [Streptomyces sp. MST-110588]|uniref:FG-GAP repeat domain-containing protein n=1 Tax=Streptomyces sp. MST-110588 TaxID=2833628 RepID=UPI001F5C16E4|nr:VCBS repeat-containing protein [Streptomyces sp. MST-110588]UNO39092.1 VCBS repeat-containing protein [Streptomyces sp. MST-110588]
MKRLSHRRRGLARLATVATAVTLAATVTGTAVAAVPAASGPAKKTTSRAARVANKPTPAAPFFFLSGILPSGQMYVYMPDGKGGFDSRSGAYLWRGLKYSVSVDPDLTGYQDGSYQVMSNGVVNLWRGGHLKKVATGWQQYTGVLSPGTLARAAHPDLLARDKQGVLWRFQTKANGTLAPRVKVGTGWNQYSQITGVGDFSGDKKPDIVARDKKGVLWLYKGTGDGRKPLAPRVRVSGGWNQYNKLVGTGDVDGDRRSDLLARDPKGGLWLYKGTGKASAPFKPRVKVGSGFQQYRDLF